MKWLTALALLPLLATEPARDAAAGGDPAPPLERWRFNPRERTARGLAAWKNEKPEAAVPAFDSALRLRPGDALATYNAGTARLGAGEPGAEELLGRAAQGAPVELAPDAFYNLGNARLAGKNAGGAIDAYRQALRRRPDFPEAKRNLELAWKLLEQQRQQQQHEQDDQKQEGQKKEDQKQGAQKQPSGQGDEDQNRSGAENNQTSSETPPQRDSDRRQPPAPPADEEPRAGEQRPETGASGASSGSPQERPLPQFHDQQDMTAEQAAAILQAVENLERQQRRDQAAERVRGKARVEKDW